MQPVLGFGLAVAGEWKGCEAPGAPLDFVPPCRALLPAQRFPFPKLISALGAANTELSSFSQGWAGVGVNAAFVPNVDVEKNRAKHWFSHLLDDLY